MCLFGVGGARRRPHRAPSLTISTSDCAVLLRSWRTKRSGIMREMSLLCACRKERSDGNSDCYEVNRVVCPPPAERFRGFPQTKSRGGTEYGRDALNDTFGECVVAKANEAYCGAQTPKSKHREEGGKLH